MLNASLALFRPIPKSASFILPLVHFLAFGCETRALEIKSLLRGTADAVTRELSGAYILGMTYASSLELASPWAIFLIAD